MIPTKIKATLPARLHRLNISAMILAAYSGQGSSQISRFVNNKLNMRNEDAQDLHKWMCRLENLAHRARPLKLDLRDIPHTLSLLRKLENGQLHIMVCDISVDPIVDGGLSALSGMKNLNG